MSYVSVIQQLKAAMVDPALVESIGFTLAKECPEIVSFLLAREQNRRDVSPVPPFASMTALETTIFDNWVEYGGKRPKRGQKGHNKHRFVAVMKSWTCPAPEIDFRKAGQARRFEVLLMTAPELHKKALDHARKGRQSLAEAMDALAGVDAMQDALGGVLASRVAGEGTTYHPQRLLVVQRVNSKATGLILDMQHRDVTEIAPFVPTDAASRALKANAQLQSRHAAQGVLTNWKS